MPKKQVIVSKPELPVKKAAPRVKAAKHRAIPTETATGISHETPLENASQAIAVVAYGYWEARGRQGGDPMEDWFRAENEVRQRSSR